MTQGFRIPSGLVIAIGRLMLATLFLLTIWLDESEPAQERDAVLALLAAYAVFSTGLLIAAWSNWWLDARLAGWAHAVDIFLFTVLVFTTEGYASPYFTFFMFILLSAAIRWGWRATALTAVLVTLLYLLAGLFVARSTAEFDLQRFVIRSGHLFILSLILIWFGINQWRAAIRGRGDELVGDPSLDESPQETGLQAAMQAFRAQSGMFVWSASDGGATEALVARDGSRSATEISGAATTEAATLPFLYDLRRDRALMRNSRRSLRAFAARELVNADAASALNLNEGIAIPVRTGTGEGTLFLEGLRLSTDDLDRGEQLAAGIATHIQRHALIRAAEDSAEARSRLSLARDLHDSVVQFLAGTAIRLEAMKRSEASGRDLEPELNELKQLVLLEQGELRSFISALRSESQITVEHLSKDLAALAERLSRQWNVDCDFSAEPADLTVPGRLHLDAHQLVREAVANAVRHAGAKRVRIALGADREELRIQFINDGAGFEGDDLPKSLKERVEQAGGSLDLARGMDVTRVSVSLPLNGRPR